MGLRARLAPPRTGEMSFLRILRQDLLLRRTDG